MFEYRIMKFLTSCEGAVVVVILWQLDLQLPMQEREFESHSGKLFLIQHYH
jgi:hypothetical protein